MFNNANVLFKTKFVDGVSTVTRYVQHANKSNDGKENNTAANAKKKQAGANKRARLEEVA
jgi:structural maintenance of chromosome 2